MPSTWTHFTRIFKLKSCRYGETYQWNVHNYVLEYVILTVTI